MAAEAPEQGGTDPTIGITHCPLDPTPGIVVVLRILDVWLGQNWNCARKLISNATFGIVYCKLSRASRYGNRSVAKS
jgi:hypothetical protein